MCALDKKLDCVQIVVITGQNANLTAYLNTQIWHNIVHPTGFIRNVYDYLRVADVFITKAGPGSLNEAAVIGVPLIIYDQLLGQEVGNVDYIVSGNGGVFETQPEQIADTVRNWLANPAHLEHLKTNIKQLAHPNAAPFIAQWLVSDD